MPNSDEIIEQNRQVYNRIAEHFAETRKKISVDISGLAAYAKAGDRVLDIGCGSGRLCDYAVAQNNDYVGVDQSEEQVRVAGFAHPGIKFVVGKMTDLPFDNEQFDIVFCIAALHHLPDRESRVAALTEMKRVAKPWAYVVLTNWNMHGDFAVAKIKKGEWQDIGGENFTVPWKDSKGIVLGERIYHRFTSQELEELFLDVGLKIENQNIISGASENTGDVENIVSILKT